MKNFRDCFRLTLVVGLLLGGYAGSALAQSAPPAAASGYDFKAAVVADLQNMEKKYTALAQAMPAEKYTWRPGDGVRSVSEVYMHVAEMNFSFPAMLGAPKAPGFDRNGYEKSITDKTKVGEQLSQSFAYAEKSIQGISDADLEKNIKMFNRTTTGKAMLLGLISDLHEHLGQAIAYARMNNITPPWTAAMQQRGGPRPE